MGQDLFKVPRSSDATFMGAPVCTDVSNLTSPFAAIGLPFGNPYDIEKVHYGATQAPRAVRDRSKRYGGMQDRYDFDLEGEPFDGRAHPVEDLGDVVAHLTDFDANSQRASEAVRQVLAKGCRPIVLGGDDSTTWMSIRGFDQQEPITIVQFDAHIDFRDEVDGHTEGYSSPMRRASEAGHVQKIIHVGTRGPGSGRTEDRDATIEAGNIVVSPRDIRAHGAKAVLQHLPEASRVYVAFDVDGLDPSVAPGTSAPLPGGIDFIDAQDIIAGLAKDHDLVGMNIAEHYPGLDVNGITSLVITRLIATWIGLELRKPMS